MLDAESIALELDAMHQNAKHSFEQRDLAAYRELFLPDLEYCQADGRIINRDQLMRDVELQFHRLRWVRSSFVREFIEPGEDRAHELLKQTALAGTIVFFIVHRIWEITRRGRYYWRRVSGRWRIDRVEVIEEHVHGRFRFGMLSSMSDK